MKPRAAAQPLLTSRKIAGVAHAEKDRANGMTRLVLSDVWRLVGLGFLLSHSLRSPLDAAGARGLCSWRKRSQADHEIHHRQPFADPDKAARRLMPHEHPFEHGQDGRIYIEHLNGRFCSATRARRLSMRRPVIDDRGTFVKLTHSGADLFA